MFTSQKLSSSLDKALQYSDPTSVSVSVSGCSWTETIEPVAGKEWVLIIQAEFKCVQLMSSIYISPLYCVHNIKALIYELAYCAGHWLSHHDSQFT